MAWAELRHGGSIPNYRAFVGAAPGTCSLLGQVEIHVFAGAGSGLRDIGQDVFLVDGHSSDELFFCLI